MHYTLNGELASFGAVHDQIVDSERQRGRLGLNSIYDHFPTTFPISGIESYGARFRAELEWRGSDNDRRTEYWRLVMAFVMQERFYRDLRLNELEG